MTDTKLADLRVEKAIAELHRALLVRNAIEPIDTTVETVTFGPFAPDGTQEMHDLLLAWSTVGYVLPDGRRQIVVARPRGPVMRDDFPEF
jgi:hypothetical protein